MLIQIESCKLKLCHKGAEQLQLDCRPCYDDRILSSTRKSLFIIIRKMLIRSLLKVLLIRRLGTHDAICFQSALAGLQCNKNVTHHALGKNLVNRYYH